ncbi:hypothetical protein GIB67_035325 [Kingdonia uniflora]|uniref:BED-type domain-containing protein n=1 Tax=Kingdonia uniflora TaxID=39325 RepID=A0A7J7LYF6_9MAGN|nr:hypothetical protein GIB67_035325 [Kingdonia uniflora]
MSVEGSQGSTGRYRPTNSNDPGWDYGQPVDGNRDHVKCDFCGHVSKGGIKRLKQHLVKASYKGTMYKDVRKCDKVPQDVVDVLRSFMEGKQKITEEKQSKKDEMIRNVNVYGNDDDEVEEVMIQIPKKRKGPMDAFVAPIDVDFRPRAPNSNENKKALENIHGYIADFFYENSISFNCARSDSYSKMMQAIVQYNDPSTFKPPSYNDLRVKILKKKKEETSNWVDNFKVHWETYGVTIMTDWWTDGKGRTLINFLVNCPKGTVFLKSIDGSAHIHDAELIYKMLKDVIEEVGEKNVIQIHTKKRNCLEHDRMRDLAYIQYNRRLKKRYEERISGKEIDPIVLKSFDECAEWLVPDDARDDIVLGTDMTYGVLEDAEDGFDDPPLTRTSRTNTASHCSQEVASSSRSTTRHLQDSSDDDDYDVDANYDMGDGDDDGIDSGSDEDI